MPQRSGPTLSPDDGASAAAPDIERASTPIGRVSHNGVPSAPAPPLAPVGTPSAGVGAMSATSIDTTGDVWIFGYGSLVWRPSPELQYVREVNCVAHGFVRRFWQASPDHRGTPEAMGRVCTLVPRPGAACGGVAFLLDPAVAESTVARLLHRERAGYDVYAVAVACADGVARTAYAFSADEHNVYWTGPPPALAASASGDEAQGGWVEAGALATPWSVPATAAVIAAAAGPSGTNVEYLHRLVSALRVRGVRDRYVEALWGATRAAVARLPAGPAAAAARAEVAAADCEAEADAECGSGSGSADGGNGDSGDEAT